MNNENKLLGSALLGLLEGKLLGNALNDIIKKYDDDVKKEKELIDSRMDDYADKISKM